MRHAVLSVNQVSSNKERGLLCEVALQPEPIPIILSHNAAFKVHGFPVILIVRSCTGPKRNNEQARLCQSRITGVVALSGSNKSSVVRAGGGKMMQNVDNRIE